MKIPALLFLALLAIQAQSAPVRSYLNNPPEWFASAEALAIAENILSFQTPRGDWPKNTEIAAAPFDGDPKKLSGTFDNSATIPELRFLARLKGGKFQQAFFKGLDHVLAAQYANGGWPQSFPPGAGYNRHITFNDGTMVNILNFVRDVAGDPIYQFVPAEKRAAAARAFDRGVACILKCQIKVDGRLTAWCAQHDEVDFSPRPARTYELVSLSGSESAGIVRLLMSLDKPSPDVIAAVDAAMAWFESVKLKGIKQTQVADPNAPKGTDKRIVEDPNAPPLWARFYHIETMKPMYVDRNGIPRDRLSDIGYERRNGYAWLVNSPAAVLADFERWRRKVRNNH